MSYLRAVGRQTDKQTADIFSSLDIEIGMRRKSGRVRKRDVEIFSLFYINDATRGHDDINLGVRNMYSLFAFNKYFFLILYI